MTPDLTGLFTPDGAIAFLAGILARRAYCWVHNKWLDRVEPAKAPHREHLRGVVLAWGVVMMGMIYIGVQTQTTHNQTVTQAEQAKAFAAQVAACETELVTAVRNRDALKSREDTIANEEHKAWTDWLALGFSPPQDVFNLQTIDPRYQAWARTVNAQYIQRLNELESQRVALADELAHHPLPEPTCGK